MAYIMTDKKRYQMTDEEKAERARIKEVHRKLREPLRGGKVAGKGGSPYVLLINRRYDLLAWAFARGFKFRRCETSHHTQIVNGEPYEHNLPCVWMIWERLVRAGADPGLLRASGFAMWEWSRVAKADASKAIEAWLADPTGAIAAPALKPKKLFSPIVAAYRLAAGSKARRYSSRTVESVTTGSSPVGPTCAFNSVVECSDVNRKGRGFESLKARLTKKKSWRTIVRNTSSRASTNLRDTNRTPL